MSSISALAYPRPDFVRPGNQNWTSLNGQWDFAFDDENVGLCQGWHLDGLPEEVFLPDAQVISPKSQYAEADKIAGQIGAQPETCGKTNDARGPEAKTHPKRKITVPYVFQSPASGIHDRGAHEVFWYERLISDIRSAEESTNGHRLLLRFGAVDYEATVWVNGLYVGEHCGGHVPFDVDITDAIKASRASRGQELRLTIRVRDSPHDLAQPRGKQYWRPEPENIFYTPSSGIWQSVWLESVPRVRLADSRHGTVLRSNDIDTGFLHAKVSTLGQTVGQRYRIELDVSLAEHSFRSRTEELSESNCVNFDVDLHVPQDVLGSLRNGPLKDAPLDDRRCWRDGLALWSPEHPQLYDIVLKLVSVQTGALLDEVHTYTGMRSLDWNSNDGSFRLNDHPYFQALVLDQGYWPDTGITPPSPESLKDDIVLSKSMGFNGCRKHQKVEDPIFLYWADKLGYIVWGEMANAYKFDDEYVSRFNQEWTDAVKRDINHPCIFAWTPVNESWGYPSLKDSVEQRIHIRSLYYMTKNLDITRPIVDNDGWEHVLTDLITFHDYGDATQLTQTCSTLSSVAAPKGGRSMFLKPLHHSLYSDPGSTPTPGAPILCTEFGGISVAPAETTVKGEKDWGYTTASHPDDLRTRIEALVMGIVDGGLCCGFVYTQLTDIEQEVNGLYKFDRTAKLEAGKLKRTLDMARERYYEKLKAREVKV